MPFTPFHLGPGAAFKAVGGRQFSFMIFAGSQVLMDIEPLVRIIRGDSVAHGPSHTVVGAFVIGLVSAGIGRPASIAVLRWLRIDHRALTWPVALASAFVGTYSHIGLDAIMHGDMQPLWPFAAGNSVLGLLSIGWLHLACLISGLAGVLILLARLHFSATSPGTGPSEQ